MTAVASVVRAYLQYFAAPLADFTGLSKVPAFADIILGSFLFFTVIHLVVAPLLSQKFFPDAFASGGKRGMNNWSIHVVSLVHSLVIIFLALRALDLPDLSNDRAFGWDDRAGPVLAVACGYFIWDTLDAIYNYIDMAFVLHGVACTVIYTLSFTPFLAYYGVRCLFWELSTVFLNIHWFLDKTGRTGTIFQLVNGCVLLTTFFGVRIVWGWKLSVEFYKTLYSVRHDIPIFYLAVFGAGNILLQSLNAIWFMKMINALRKRFESPPVKDTLPGSAVDGNGHRYV